MDLVGIRRTPAAVLAVALLGGLGGCGDSSHHGAVNTNVPSSSNPAAAGESASQMATGAVSDYYSAIDSRTFAEAWHFLGSQQRLADQGFQTWRSGFVTTTNTNLQSARPTKADPDTVSVAVRINTADLDACAKTVRQTFQGTWTVDLASGEP